MKRFDLEYCDGESGRCRADLREAADGDWVLYADYQALENKCSRLERELEKAGYPITFA
jgi:hypothetical protein